METSTAAATRGPRSSGDGDPTLDDAPDAIRKAAAGEKVKSASEERKGVLWLLEPRKLIEYTVPFKFETPDGTEDLNFIVRALDGRLIEKIERAATNERTGEMDELTAGANVLAEALARITDGDGGVIDPSSEAFRRDPSSGEVFVSTGMALLKKFKEQSGVLLMGAGEVRRVSGFAPDRVGTASRVLIDAAGNS